MVIRKLSVTETGPSSALTRLVADYLQDRRVTVRVAAMPADRVIERNGADERS